MPYDSRAPSPAPGNWEYPFSRHALRASVSVSPWLAIAIILALLLASWLLVYWSGGAAQMVPHWYYIPILFAATRFGPLAALIVSVVSAILAGPLTFESVALGTFQETDKWLTRAGFFIGIGQISGWLLAPAVRPLSEEIHFRNAELRLRHALARDEFFLVYQPIHSTGKQRFVGVEALLRWRHPKRGVLSPVHFMDVAEDCSLIHDLSDFVIDSACRQAAAWQQQAEAAGAEPWFVAINLSARDLERPELARRIADTLEQYKLPAHLLHIELTEGVLAMEGAAFTLRQLKNLGVVLAIDDFGTGWSSLSYLNRFTVDTLKIDRSLISDLGPSKESQALARGVVALARSLGLPTVAEGLETEEQLAIGTQLGFDHLQGYFFSRPQPAECIPAMFNLQGDLSPEIEPDPEFQEVEPGPGSK